MKGQEEAFRAGRALGYTIRGVMVCLELLGRRRRVDEGEGKKGLAGRNEGIRKFRRISICVGACVWD